MKDVQIIKAQGHAHQVVDSLLTQAVESALNGYTLVGGVQGSFGMGFVNLSQKVEKELNGEEAADKVIDEVPTIGDTQEPLSGSLVDSFMKVVAKQDVSDASPDSAEAGKLELDFEDNGIPPVVIDGEEVVVGSSQGTPNLPSADAITELKALTKKKPLLAWMERNGVSLEGVPTQPAALKKALLAATNIS